MKAAKTIGVMLRYATLIAFFAVIAATQADVGQPRLLSLHKPVYPPLARQASITGVVVVEVTVGQDGAKNAAVLSGHPMLREAALTSARQSQFDCQMCNAVRPYRLIYKFKQSSDGDCCDGFSVVPTVDQGEQSKGAEGQEQTEITIVAEHTCICDPATTIVRVRSIKCLYLWKCSSRGY